MNYPYVWILIFFWLLPISKGFSLDAGDCAAPILSSFSSPSTSGFTLHWIDFNPDVIYWEIETVEKNSNPTGNADYSLLTSKYFTIDDLEQGKTYQIYIRSVCLSGSSTWNGPYRYNTAIENGAGCHLDLGMTDDNCPDSDSFFIEVDLPLSDSLGYDVFLDQLSLTVDHPWVADLELSLISPSGIRTLLSSFHGIGKQDYGNPEDLNCNQPLHFSDFACEYLNEYNYPYTGSFKPDEPLAIFNNGQNPNGIWTLLACDRVHGDVGKLTHVELKFSQADCQLPDTFYISGYNDTQIHLNWNNGQKCDSILVHYGPEGFDPSLGTVQLFACIDGAGIIDNLNPDFTGQLYYSAICSGDTLERPCSLSFKTSCAPVSLKSNFDLLDICVPGCNNSCMIDSIWSNAEDDDQNWYVFQGATGTEFTGPDGDYSLYGKFLYTESSSIDCQDEATSILRSNCLFIPESQNTCSFSYKAYMFGEGINKLVFEITTDGGFSWQPLDSLIGPQGQLWLDRVVDLSAYSGIIVQVQFVSHGAFNQFGDIAIDELSFQGALLAENKCYYRDQDMDGFGDVNQINCLCSDTAPPGFVDNDGDCNDLIELIYPGAMEIPCNLIDENCNGDMDDHEGNDIILSNIVQLISESCNGSSDGTIEIMLSGGTAPYEILWSSGDTGVLINNLKSGFYVATVSDATGCQTQLEPLFIDYELKIGTTLSILSPPTCPGIANGSIQAVITGGAVPYSYVWNTGDTTEILENISTGTYELTVYDQNNCSAVSEPILIQMNSPISAGVQLKSDAFCNGGNEGYFVLGAFGGQAPYNFEWQDGSTSNILQNLSAGFYSCTIQDQAGCEVVLDSLEISEPPELLLHLDVLDDPICFNEPGGSIEVNASGGSPPYSFFWSNGAITDDIFLLEPGSYSVTVYDTKACQANLQDLVLNAPEPIVINLILKENTSCPGAPDGNIVIEATGGGGNFDYFWSNGLEGETELNNIPVGDYNVVVVDQFGCKSRLENIEILSNNDPLEILIGDVIEPLCFGDTDGEINIQISEASLPIDVNWSSGQKKELFQLTDMITGLSAGNYQATVTDNNGCVGISEMIELPDWDQLSYSVIQYEDISCFGLEDGIIEIQAFGGNPPYTYFWDNGAVGSVITSLPEDSYKLLIIDDNSCSVFTSNFVVQEPLLLEAEISSTPSINGQMNGSAAVYPSGGTMPYSIQWDENTNLQTGNTALNLAPGDYHVSITDARDCFLDTLITVSNIVGVNDIDKELNIIIGPNPVKDELLLLNSDTKELEVSFYICDANGSILLNSSEKLLKHNKRIDVSGLASGMYYLKITESGSGRIQYFPFIKIDY